MSTLKNAPVATAETMSDNHPSPTNDSESSVADPIQTLRIGLMGLGTVGQGLCTLLAQKGDALADRHGVRFEISRVLVRDLQRERHVAPDAPITNDLDEFVAGDYDLVIEAIGGIEPAGYLIATFLARGVPVVTANKALLAERGQELQALAAKHRTTLRYEASVAAGIPILGMIERALQSTTVTRVAAILNGTSNFILTRLAVDGMSMSAALSEAQRLGYAEANPTLDVSGMDAAQKLSVLARTLGGHLPVSAIDVTGIEFVRPDDCVRARVFGYALKPVAVADLRHSPNAGYVGPALVRASHPLAGVSDVVNGVHLSGDTLVELFLSGPGAGGLPTAASILDDMLASTAQTPPRRAIYRPSGTTAGLAAGITPPIKPRLDGRWFLSLTVNKSAGRVEDLLDFVASTGLMFRELREFRDAGQITLAGLTAHTRADRVETLSARLRAVEAVDAFRAYRVVDDANEEI